MLITLKGDAMDNALSFATDVIQAIPEPVCLYLAGPDILIANDHWKENVGEFYRLADLGSAGFNPETLEDRLAEAREVGAQVIVNPDTHDCNNDRTLLLRAMAGNTDIFVMTLRDQSEIRRVEQMRKDFIANVSHELRTPLTAVKGYIETLLDPQFLTMERVKQFLPVIFEHTERLHNLMLDLLSLSRLENPSTHIELSPIRLSEHVRDSIEAVTPLARMKNVDLEFEPLDDETMVLANGEHMERILVNLLDNAIKYSDRNGQVSVWTERKGDYMWTHVKDDGPGIAPEELGRVFERFYRTRSALSGRARGSGLGLAIVKHIIHQLGGDIRVDSRPGQGSHFYFSLKLAPDQEENAPKILGHRMGMEEAV
jgi:two-component system phosphate regulon sensor histidine kinase PhoR